MANKTNFVLVSPEIGNANGLVKRVVEEALISFFLAYSLPDEIYDDRWYYTPIRDYYFDESGLPNRYACDSEQQFWNYCRDPDIGLREITEQVKSHLENIIELNERAINQLYDRRVFTVPFDIVFHRNAITMVFRG